MLYQLLMTLFVINCFLLVLLVLVQKGKGGMGIGQMGGGAQMLFGGSGGQDFFQKTTWVLGAIFMVGSLVLGLMKSSSLYDVRYIQFKQAEQAALPEAPVETPSESTKKPVAEDAAKQ